MTVHGQDISIHRSVTVPLPRERAFELFTTRMGAFWPRVYHIGGSDLADVVVEPRAGGRWHERGVDGSECDWGRVGVWEPPARVVLVWQIGADWKVDRDLETEVEVSFTEEEPGRTRVDLVHHHLERYGDRAEEMRGVFGTDEGWTGIMAAFAASVAA